MLTPENALKLSGVAYKNNGEGQWFTVACPYHANTDDLEHAKGRVNPENGVFTCFSCKETTTVIGYIATLLKKPMQVVKLALDAAVGDKDSLPVSIVDEFHAALLTRGTEYLAKLRDKHGIGLDEINKYRLGVKLGESPRITIPIFSHDDKLLNIRQYSYTDTQNKMIGWKGHNGNALYLRNNIQSSTDVYIAEGEFKAILLNSRGFNCVAPTGGAGNWNAEWNELFKDKDVVVVYDVDKAGRNGAAQICRGLVGIAKSIRNVFLDDVKDFVDTNGKQNGDITDYFVKRQKTADDFRQLVLATACYEAPQVPRAEPQDEKVYDVELAQTSEAKFSGKKVATKVLVSAKAVAPYIIPKKVRTICKADQKYCVHCQVSTNLGYEFEIPSDSETILSLINTTKKNHFETLKKLGDIHGGCKACEFDTLESHNVEELRLIPQIAVGHKTAEMVVRKVFYTGHGIETNTSYEIKAKVCTEPDTQHATLVVYDVKPAVDDINEFRLQHDLSVFQPAEWTVAGVEAKLADIYEDLELNITRIYRRRDLHLFYDLVFHSALYIPFQGKLIKGWADALCIGDSGQGKSECSSRLIDHYKAGERVDSKRSSVAGLLGGLEENAGRWFTKWGTIPLNDRRLVVLEEIKGMPVESLAVLTDMRSSGIAEIHKIEKAKTNARTRLVWISNSRSGRKLCEYNYGVDAVKELIGSLEDIRRFDMVIAVSSGDVGTDIINMASHLREKCEHHYSSELSKHLIMWAWSRSEKQITIEQDAESEILAAATRMGAKYSSSCPIVEPADQRLKLLRLSTALACRTFSTDEEGLRVIVQRCHVQVVERFLNRCYESKALGYSDYSLAQQSETILRDIPEVTARLKDVPNARDTIQSMVDSDSITFQTLMDCTEWMKDTSSEFIGFLVRKGALKTTRRGGYRKTAAFIALLKELDRSDILVNETLRAKDAKGQL